MSTIWASWHELESAQLFRETNLKRGVMVMESSNDPMATRCQWIADKLKRLRIQRGLTLIQVANRMGWENHSRICDYEHCRYVPNIETFLGILSAIGSTPNDFFADMPSIEDIGGPVREARGVSKESNRVIGQRTERAKQILKKTVGTSAPTKSTKRK